jgi:putative endonuclease
VTPSRRKVGKKGEEWVARYLTLQGCTILARNWRCTQGELDIVARSADTLVLVEVRTRRSEALGPPEESVTPAKQARLRALAEAAVQAWGWQGPWRIDVAAVDLTGDQMHIRWLKDAVEG